MKSLISFMIFIGFSGYVILIMLLIGSISILFLGINDFHPIPNLHNKLIKLRDIIFNILFICSVIVSILFVYEILFIII